MAMKLQVLLLLLLCIASELTTHSVSNSLERCDAETEYNSYGYIDERKKALNDSSCTYQVVIGASCSSPNFTTGDIIIRFGDPLRNQVYEEKLIVPRSRTIEQCSRDIFQLNGACVSSICFVELYSYGAMDGWKPERQYGLHKEQSDDADFCNQCAKSLGKVGASFHGFVKPHLPKHPNHSGEQEVNDEEKVADEIKRFFYHRGNNVLERFKCSTQLGWSLTGEFDQSILLWHKATD
ncbi:hypothetical protein JHK87_025177 [Glycine soja]|nr:hypothetical protein JHK87_025177 [Glycine soja]